MVVDGKCWVPGGGLLGGQFVTRLGIAAMMYDWMLYTRWGRFKQYWWRYAPIPWKCCVVCGQWFFNKWFWHPITWKHGCPEYCSRACAGLVSCDACDGYGVTIDYENSINTCGSCEGTGKDITK